MDRRSLYAVYWVICSVILSQGGEELQTKNERKKAKWIAHVLRRNCLLKHVIEGNIEGRIPVTGRR
jgi:hypothetical protein